MIDFIVTYLSTFNFDAIGLAKTHEVLLPHANLIYLTDGVRQYVAVYYPGSQPFLADLPYEGAV